MAEGRNPATNETKRSLIFVTGYFGAPIKEEAHRIASCKGWPVLDLDAAIEERDGRSIPRVCMMGGEHAYRNAEYEMLVEICGGEQSESAAAEAAPKGELLVEKICGGEQSKSAAAGAVSKGELLEPDGNDPGSVRDGGLVVACGDGVLYDDDSRALILQHELVIAGEDRSIDELWEGARKEESTYHAFMKFGTDEEKRAKFEDHHNRQIQLFALVAKEKNR